MNPFQRSWIVAALTLATLIIGTGADAQAQTRSTMIGTIKDGTGVPLRGVTVTLERPTVPGEARTTLTNDRGTYRLPQLVPGLYDLTATRQGWKTVRRTGLRMPLGATLTVDLMLTEGEGTDVVTVSGAGPVVDVTAAASTTKLTIEDLENLPVGGGAAILQLVPGVTPFSAFGSGADTSQLTVDGSPITVTLRGAAPSAAFHSYWMEEVQIAGLGADAEHSEFSGVIANIAIRSGSNRFAGLLEYGTTRPQFVADNTSGLPDTLRSQFPPLEILSDWTSDAQIGGPMKRDRLFFFMGFHYFRRKIVQPGRIGNVPLDVRAPAFVTKLNWAPVRNLKLEGYGEANQNRSRGGLPRNALPETAGDQSSRMRSWNARATWTLNPETLVELRNGGVEYHQWSLPNDRRVGPPPRFDRATGIRSGNAATFGDQLGNRYVTGASMTRFVDGFAGRSHELEGGFELERTKYRQVSGFPGGRSHTDVLGVPGLVQLWAGDTVEGTGTRTALYAQDVWSAASHLTIHAGVRLALNRGSVADKGAVFKTNPVSPRLGVAWDVSADHKTVVRAAYGRLHEGLYTSLFDFMNTSGRTPRITTNAAGVEINRQTPEGNVAVDDDLAHAYVDQYLVGIEHELFPDFSFTLQYVGRTFGDIWGLIDTGSQYAPVQGRDPGPDGVNFTADDGALLTVSGVLNPGQSFTVLTNPDGAYRRYHAVQAIGQKRFSRNWQVLGAYTWSRTRGNMNPGTGENRASGVDSGSNGVFFNPNRQINAEGPVSFDYAHQLNLQGTYLLPAWGGLGLSAGYRYLSGGAWGRVALITTGAPPVQGQPVLQGQIVRIEPRGTRRIEGGSALDVRIEKTFPLGGSGRTLGIYADVFNFTNQGVPLGLTKIDNSTATFGQPNFWADPRTVRVAGRFRF